jgi:hypothetical protein
MASFPARMRTVFLRTVSTAQGQNIAVTNVSALCDLTRRDELADPRDAVRSGRLSYLFPALIEREIQEYIRKYPGLNYAGRLRATRSCFSLTGNRGATTT